MDDVIDAILMGRITRYEPFPPQAIGLELVLVSATTGKVVWNAAGVVDASDPETIRAARGGGVSSVLVDLDPANAFEGVDDPEGAFVILESPQAFATFAATAFASTAGRK